MLARRLPVRASSYVWGAGREPGFATSTPRAQSGQDTGSHVGSSTVSSAATGTPSAARPALRSTSAAAPTTSAPAAARHVHRLPRGQPRGDHVLDDEHALGGRELEPAPQGQPAVLAFGEQRPHAERARNFMADDHAAERRRQHDGRGQLAHLRLDRSAERAGGHRILQHEGALQVAAAVQAGREAEVALEQGARLPEQLQQGIAIELTHDVEIGRRDAVRRSTGARSEAPRSIQSDDPPKPVLPAVRLLNMASSRAQVAARGAAVSRQPTVQCP